MFKKATHSLLHQIDEDGTLIPVSRLNDSEKLKPLAVVIKCPGRWSWQKAKYKPTDFTLNDVLQGKPIEPVLEKKEFLKKYEERQKGNASGSVEVDMVGVGMKAQGRGASNILSSFGQLHKESVKMPRFLKDSKDRKVDLQHHLLKQTRGKNQVFTLVKERIFTTTDWTINFKERKEGSFITSLKLISSAMVHLNKSICLEKVRDVVLEIPSSTVLAYSVSELNIKSNGHYEVGVSPDGIAADASITQYPVHSMAEVDGLWPLTTEGSSLSVLNKELQTVTATLCKLACLTPETRFSLLNLFQEILPDQMLLGTLEEKLEKLSEEFIDDHYSPDASNEVTDRFLDLLLYDMETLSTAIIMSDCSLPAISCNQNGGHGAPAKWKAANTNHNGSNVQSNSQKQLILTAMHMLISAAEELNNYGATLLKTFSSETINELNDLVTHLTSDSQQVPFTELPFLLRNGTVPLELERLFMSSNITLKIDNKELHAEIGSGSKVLPLALCVIIRGLAYLNESCEIDVEI